MPVSRPSSADHAAPGSLPPPVALVIGSSGRVTSADGPVREIFGVGPAELIGTDPATLFAAPPGPTFAPLDHARAWAGVTLRPPASSEPRSVTVVPLPGRETRSVILVAPTPAPEVDAATALALRTSNVQLESFASVAAHDLQEPLRKIRAFSDRVRTLLDPATSDQALGYLDRVDVAAARMQTLITDLLALARLTGRPPEKSLVSLDDVVALVRADLADQIREASAAIRSEALPDIVADPSQMRQLFGNLLGNALKYRKPDVAPEIAITVSTGPDRISMTVSDNGIGFSNQYVPKIFAPFERLHGRDAYAGTGVGLALCRTIVERHGGTISAHGTPGIGAAFTVDLPRSPA